MQKSIKMFVSCMVPLCLFFNLAGADEKVLSEARVDQAGAQFGATGVSLKIFDLREREVAEIISGHFAAGTHSYRWEANGFARGVYVYQLRTDSYTIARKMVLMQ